MQLQQFVWFVCLVPIDAFVHAGLHSHTYVTYIHTGTHTDMDVHAYSRVCMHAYNLLDRFPAVSLVHTRARSSILSASLLTKYISFIYVCIYVYIFIYTHFEYNNNKITIRTIIQEREWLLVLTLLDYVSSNASSTEANTYREKMKIDFSYWYTSTSRVDQDHRISTWLFF